MEYATRFPEHPGKLILVSSAVNASSHAREKVEMFGHLGGDKARNLAKRRFIDGDTSEAVLKEWLRVALPLYTQKGQDPQAWSRVVSNPAVTAWFTRPDGEAKNHSVLPMLGSVKCPTLVLGGRLDPMHPIECQREIAAALPQHLVTYREIEDCGHGVMPDAPHEAIRILRHFIQNPLPEDTR